MSQKQKFSVFGRLRTVLVRNGQFWAHFEVFGIALGRPLTSFVIFWQIWVIFRTLTSKGVRRRLKDHRRIFWKKFKLFMIFGHPNIIKRRKIPKEVNRRS